MARRLPTYQDIVNRGMEAAALARQIQEIKGRGGKGSDIIRAFEPYSTNNLPGGINPKVIGKDALTEIVNMSESELAQALRDGRWGTLRDTGAASPIMKLFEETEERNLERQADTAQQMVSSGLSATGRFDNRYGMGMGGGSQPVGAVSQLMRQPTTGASLLGN